MSGVAGAAHAFQAGLELNPGDKVLKQVYTHVRLLGPFVTLHLKDWLMVDGPNARTR